MGRVLELVQGEELKWLREQVDQFVEKTTSDYVFKCEKKCQNISLGFTHTKNFYDSVWGTIEINEGEIIILDSPILQRLRNIKQLGLADMLYSGATHTRFSHTLGVLQTSDVMVSQIQKELERKQVNTEKSVRQVIRLAAIFHDCGHLFCSHASERYFQSDRSGSLYDRIKGVRECFQKNLEIKPALSEIIAILIVNSTVIRKLLEIVQNGLEGFQFDNYNQDILIEKIICMIIGFPYSEKTIPYTKVISGQIDADKLDYLKRDSHFTGVPVAVDMSRVFQKLRVVLAQKNYEMVAQHEEVSSVYKMAIAPAAINTIDQLVISRFMMFENVYYHQKTLTAEEMLRYAMHELDSCTKGLLDNFTNILLLSDRAVISDDFEFTVKNMNGDIDIVDQERFDAACGILKNLYKRQLFKRCVAFTDRNLTKVIQRDVEFYHRIVAEKVVDERNEFMNEVISEVKDIKARLEGSKFYYYDKTDVLFISSPDISAASLNSNIAIDDKTNKDRDMEFESDNWLQSRASRKPQNYLVSYPEDRYIVYIAAEMVLLRKYGLLINDMMIYSSEDEKHINEIKKFLDKGSYYRDLSILAPDQYIETHMGKIRELLEKWKTYEIFDYTTGTGLGLDESYFVTHLKQYLRYREEIGEFHVFVKGYLKMLSQMRIVTKQEIASALKSNLSKILQQEGCNKNELYVSHIGGVQDSSALIAYHMNIVNNVLGSRWRTIPLEQILKDAVSGQRIVFLEDACCSGKQILSVFETYMGIPLEDRQTKEKHVEELPEELKDKLRKCRLYFSFIYYERENEAFFYERMRDIGLSNVAIVAKQTFPEGYFKTRLEESVQEEREVVKKYIQRAGRDLLQWKAHDSEGNRKPSWTDERMEKSLLGYNDAQQLVAFSWNTPTYTVTPLWMGVDEEDFKWVPLFPRIDK